MAAISATIQVRDANAHGLPKGSPSQLSAKTILNILAPTSPAATAAAGPARKRRKLDDGRIIGLWSPDALDEGKSVVLAKVDLQLQMPITPSDPAQVAITPSENRVPFVVSLESFARTSKTTCTLSLWNPAAPTPGLDLDGRTTAESLDAIESHLDTIATLSTTKEGRKRSTRVGASFCHSILTPPSQPQGSFHLEAQVRWTTTTSVVENVGIRTPQGHRDMQILSRYFPNGSTLARTPWTLSDFYDSVHIPPDDTEVSPRIEESLQETKLYPFQQRAVAWLLRREGVAYSSTTNELQPLVEPLNPPISFATALDADENACQVSHLRGIVILDRTSLTDPIQTLRGGILAEEMGLGKTVELIALMMHNRRDVSDTKVFDSYIGAYVKPSGATLIISPPSILEQWKSEIQSHSPALRVYHYKGLPPHSASKAEKSMATVEHLMQFDVVLTTYAVLSREVHFAKPPPERSFRHKKVHHSPRSPLVEISWWRVVLDEAQMVESGVSQAAEVARIIPRCNAWAVTGTPLRKDVQDLRGLLTFLRFEPFARSKAVWDRLDKPSFKDMFGRIALRHTKDRVREELRLPPQKRIVITVPFTAIEEQNYSEMVRQMCDACGLSPEGIPMQEGHDASHPEVVDRMRTWLVRLRQTCLHAHVGRRNRKALGAKNGPLRTVHEVLEVMIDQNDTTLKAEAREYILAQMRSGHVKGNAGNYQGRSKIALPFYEEALKDAQSYVQICRNELVLEKEKIGIMIVDQEPDSDQDENEGQELGRVPAIRKSLRSFLELEHACKFFIGTAYYQIKSNEHLTNPESSDFHLLEKQETEAYDQAKKIRRELLRESEGKATHQMKNIRSKKPFYQLASIDDLPDLGGIEGKKILDMMDNVSAVLNSQASELVKYRQKVVDILLSPLVDEDEGKETTGDEYEDSTKVQDELYAYVMALRTLVADRNAVVNGLDDILTEHELKEAYKQALNKDDDPQGRGHAPQLVIDFVEIRRKLKPMNDIGSLKGVVAATRSLLTSLQWRADGGDSRAKVEFAAVQKQFLEIQKVAINQGKAISELEKELELFRTAMNQRLEFYRQLQHISDTVAPWREELDPIFEAQEFANQQHKLEQSKARLAGCKTKHNYLANLRLENARTDATHKCVICLEDFEIGVLTTCGHKYCKGCINYWWHSHRTCPMCKIRLYSTDFRDITFKPAAIIAQEEKHEQGSPSQPSTPSSSGTSLYSDMSDSNMKEIKGIDLDGSYGSKVDMIARHLLWIRNNDPGAKSIIFSQFGDFLEVLREALKKWKIGCSSIGDKHGIAQFRADPAVECFLLDAKSDSSGLNLVNATYVFLCEPLINPAIELQAIARVHRIGQQRATTVFMYLVSDSVEEAIYDISVARRLEHIGRSSRSGTATPVLQEKTIEAANSHEMEAAPIKQLLRKKGDGEIVQVDDLWSCLFRKPRKTQRVVLDREVNRQLRAEAAEKRIAASA